MRSAAESGRPACERATSGGRRWLHEPDPLFCDLPRQSVSPQTGDEGISSGEKCACVHPHVFLRKELQLLYLAAHLAFCLLVNGMLLHILEATLPQLPGCLVFRRKEVEHFLLHVDHGLNLCCLLGALWVIASPSRVSSTPNKEDPCYPIYDPTFHYPEPPTTSVSLA